MKITIELQDTKNGTAEVRMTCEPPLTSTGYPPGPSVAFDWAQSFAAQLGKKMVERIPLKKESE